jgi:hypothetical protein
LSAFIMVISAAAPSSIVPFAGSLSGFILFRTTRLLQTLNRLHPGCRVWLFVSNVDHGIKYVLFVGAPPPNHDAHSHPLDTSRLKTGGLIVYDIDK